MARLAGGKVQLIEYPLWDTPFSGVGQSALGVDTTLFSRTGKPDLSNMQQANVIPSGGVFLISSLRFATEFRSLASTEDTVAYDTIAAQPNYTSSAARMLRLHALVGYGSIMTLKINDVPQIILPSWQFPAGGGPFGMTTVSGQAVMTNGLPSREAICRFVKPVETASLQVLTVLMHFNTFAKKGVAGEFTGDAEAGAISADFNPLEQFNVADGLKYGLVTLGGHISRDIGG